MGIAGLVPRLILGSSVVLAYSLANAQVAPMPKPQVPGTDTETATAINLTYSYTEPAFGLMTVHLYEEDGKLIKSEKWKDGNSSDSVEYSKINYIGFETETPDSNSPRVLDIDGSDGSYLVITLRDEAEARTLAAYVLQRASPSWLELIAGAWRIRKPFTCPQGVEIGCRGFKELLDHEDEEIVGYFYQRAKAYHTYACFNSEANEFLIINYARFTKTGSLLVKKFQDGQSVDSNLAKVDWSNGDYGQIVERTTPPNQKPQILGSIDSTSLSYRMTFKNRMNTTTQYSLDIRWSTGRYKEDFSGKDDKGKFFDSGLGGVCVSLNSP
jgi:hypothetical protein